MTLKSAPELLAELGASIRARRLGQNWSQEEAARRAGMGLRTWRRMESSGQATVEHLVNAAIALRCEDRLDGLFPPLAARNMNELLARQRAQQDSAPQKLRARAVRRRTGAT